MTRVGHTSRPNVLGLICLRTACVVYFDHRWWPSLMSLDSSYRDFSSDTNCVITGVSVRLHDLFIFLLYSFSSLFTNYEDERGSKRENKETKKKKKLWRHTETPIMTLLVLLERSQRNKSNNIKESHQWWPKCDTRAVQRQMSPDIFGWLG